MTVVDHREVPAIPTAYGPLRIITPTHTTMDRLAAYAHWRDGQSWDQAVMVAERQDIDWSALERWAEDEGRGHSAHPSPATSGRARAHITGASRRSCVPLYEGSPTNTPTAAALEEAACRKQ